MNLGISYVENGSFNEALVAYLKADQLKPNNEKITFNLGNLVWLIITDRIGIARSIIGQQSNSIEYIIFQYLRMGDRKMAEKMYRKSVQIEPRSQRAHINLIVYLSEHGEFCTFAYLITFNYFS